MLRKIAIAGHQLVNADWRRFSPTKAVNSSHHGDTQWARATDSNTKNPAVKRKALSTVISHFSFENGSDRREVLLFSSRLRHWRMLISPLREVVKNRHGDA